MELTPAACRLRAALSAVLVRAQARELTLVHRWLDTWTGIGLIAAGMQRQGWDLQLTAYGPLEDDIRGGPAMRTPSRAGRPTSGRRGARCSGRGGRAMNKEVL